MKTARGFTLLEVVVVLFIVGLTSAIVGPRLPQMMDRLDYTLKRETVERALEDLAYQAYRDNQDLILSGTYNHSGHVTESEDSVTDPRFKAPTIRPVSIDPNAIADIAPVTPIHPKLPLPEGWELTVPEPIYFRASGYCKGGTAQLRVGDARYIYTFRQPRCEIDVK